MTATLERRITQLEAALPPPPPDPPDRGDDGGYHSWFERILRHAPPAVLAYLDAIDAELRELPPGDARHAHFDARHPHVGDVLHAVARFANAGVTPSENHMQGTLLSCAFTRLQDHHARTGWGGFTPGTTDAAWRDAFGGMPTEEQKRAYLREWCWLSGWLLYWRGCGTQDPAIRAIMGIAEAEAALLAYDPPDMRRP